MHMPIIRGLIRRRILINYRVDPAVVAHHLPAPFRPKLIGDSALAGICLIRLEQIRPRGCPALVGIASENAAHRVAVEWTDAAGALQEGVYIWRRDTSSRLNHWAGGRIFPGEHGLARFEVQDVNEHVRLAMQSRRGEVSLRVEGRTTTDWPADSVFPSLTAASTYFEATSLGYSCTPHKNQFDGLTLSTRRWRAEPFLINRLESSFFAESNFLSGSVKLDHALIMRNIEHEWHSAGRLCA